MWLLRRNSNRNFNNRLSWHGPYTQFDKYFIVIPGKAFKGRPKPAITGKGTSPPPRWWGCQLCPEEEAGSHSQSLWEDHVSPREAGILSGGPFPCLTTETTWKYLWCGALIDLSNRRHLAYAGPAAAGFLTKDYLRKSQWGWGTCWKGAWLLQEETDRPTLPKGAWLLQEETDLPTLPSPRSSASNCWGSDRHRQSPLLTRGWCKYSTISLYLNETGEAAAFQSEPGHLALC